MTAAYDVDQSHKSRSESIRIMNNVIVHHGNCLDVVLTLDQIDAIVTDPPYHLLQASRGGSLRFNDPATPFGRVGGGSKGFMYEEWDGGDIAFKLETWRRIGRALKPGGYLLAFGGTRTWHRLACAIEDAGFVIQDTIAWVYGQGFPKGKYMLKPAFEPIIMAYKPGGKRELQIDECKIAGSPEATRFDPEKHSHDGWRFNETGAETYARAMGRSGKASAETRYTENGSSNFAAKPGPRGESPAGRWPANFCHDGSNEVLALFPDSKGQQGDLKNHGSVRESPNGILGKFPPAVDHIAREDSGSAARFFYCSKASRHDRAGSKHPTVKPQALMRWLVQLVTPPGGTVLDPFAGSGSTGQAALAVGRKAILIEQEAHWIADIHHRLELCDKQQELDL